MGLLLKQGNTKRHKDNTTFHKSISIASVHDAAIRTGYETCVLCGCRTATKRELPISQRQFYIEGSGQLCEKCYASVYITKSEGVI